MIPSLPQPLRSPHKLKPHLRASSPAGRRFFFPFPRTLENPRGGREDEDEGESEGITGEKDEEGGGRRVAVASRRPAVSPRRPVVTSRRPAVASAASSRARVVESGDREPAPIRMVGGVVPFRAVETGKREASFGSGPVFVPGRPETNA